MVVWKGGWPLGEPALKIVPRDDEGPEKPHPQKITSPKSPTIDVGDVFTEAEQKQLYREGVDALVQICQTGNDNARTGAAGKLVDLFKKTAQAGKKKGKTRINWLNPLDEAKDDEPEEELGIDDLLA